MTSDQFKNLLVFLVLIGGEGSPDLLDMHPEYILEKYYRYVNAPLPTGEGWRWGLHPGLRQVFDEYCLRWKVDELEFWKQDEEETT